MSKNKIRDKVVLDYRNASSKWCLKMGVICGSSDSG